MSVLLQKGGDFMTTLIKTPFKKKRQTIAGGETPQTPRSARGSSTARTNSLASSSVNSDDVCDSENNAYVVPNNPNNSNFNNNIYVDIDGDDIIDNEELKIGLASNIFPPELPQANNHHIPLKVSTINECEMLFEQCGEINCSKNNLLLIDEHVMTSIDDHLNNIELINKNLDKLMVTQDLIEHETLDDMVPAEIQAEKKKLKEKIAEKIKILKEARGANGAIAKGSFSSRFKNILRQSSQDETTSDEKKIKKNFLSSFKKKSLSVDETEDEIFEEISKDHIISDLDEKKSGKLSKKFSQKFIKNLLTVKIGKKSQNKKICRRCSKSYNVNEEGQRIHHSPSIADLTKAFNFDVLEFCSCNDDEFDDDGIIIKNFEYKDVS